jgi:hypothetical protein
MMINLTMKTTMLMPMLAGVLAGCGVFAGYALLRGFKHLRGRCIELESTVAALRRELDLVAAVATRSGARLKRIEKEDLDLVERIDRIEARGEPRRFDAAIDSARSGAEPDKLAERFGLSEGEAALVTRLHGRSKRA